MIKHILGGVSGVALAFAITTAAQASEFGSADEAKAMLDKAVVAVKADKDKALEMFNTGQGGFLDRDLYPFCIQVGDGKIVAQGGSLTQKYLGQNMRPLKDAVGKAYGEEIFQAAQQPEGKISEVSYMFPKPIANSPPVPKVSFVTRVGDLGCGVGYYAEPVTRDEAGTMVQKAIAAINGEGSDETYRQINNPSGQFVDRELYIVVFGLDGVILAHGADKSRVGRNTIDETDPDGKAFNRERVALAQTHSSFWHDYKFRNPINNQVEPKQMYCERLDQTVVCGGIYKP